MMADLTEEQVRTLGKAAGLDIADKDLAEVSYSLNALLEALDEIEVPGLENVEPLSVRPPGDLKELPS